MTGKRFFLLDYKSNIIYDSIDDKEYPVRFKKQKQNLCDKLNELNDEKQAIFDRIMKEIHFNDKQYVETKDECFKYTSIALSNILRQFGVI